MPAPNHQHTAEVTVLGGLPVTVKFSIQNPEPDVGLFHSYIDEWELFTESGQSAYWAQERMTKDDIETLHNELFEELNNERGRHF